MNAVQLAICTGANTARATQWLTPINDAMDKWDINTPVRQAAFLAQIGHESMNLVYSKEIWGPTSAQLRYEGRADLGNTQPGDGSKYRGRGFIQVTGRDNYTQAAKALGLDLVDHPELLEEPELAASASAWWWAVHGCNELADAGNFLALTQRINGGQNGYADRCERWAKAKEILGVS